MKKVILWNSESYLSFLIRPRLWVQETLSTKPTCLSLLLELDSWDWSLIQGFRELMLEHIWFRTEIYDAVESEGWERLKFWGEVGVKRVLIECLLWKCNLRGLEELSNWVTAKWIKLQLKYMSTRDTHTDIYNCVQKHQEVVAQRSRRKHCFCLFIVATEASLQRSTLVCPDLQTSV